MGNEDSALGWNYSNLLNIYSMQAKNFPYINLFNPQRNL